MKKLQNCVFCKKTDQKFKTVNNKLDKITE
jgi:hypothetical protein